MYIRDGKVLAQRQLFVQYNANGNLGFVPSKENCFAAPSNIISSRRVPGMQPAE